MDALLGDPRQLLFAPALLWDVQRALLAGELLLRTAAADELPAIRWRTIALIARLAPVEAQRRIDAAPAGEAAGERAALVLAETALALGELERARSLVADGAGPAWERLRAQLALADGRFADARAASERAIAGLADAPEELAAALVQRMRAAAELGDAAQARQDCERAIALCTTHAATLSVAVLQAELPLLAAGDARVAVLATARGLAVDAAKAALTEGVDVDQASLGPIPLHVHAAFARRYQDRALFVRELLDLAGLQHRAEQRGEAYATLHYAARLATRFPDVEVRELLAEAVRGYEALLGADEAARVRGYLGEREAVFLAAMRARS